MPRIPALACFTLLWLAVPARADVDLSLRAGAGVLSLNASSDTPLIGGAFDDAVAAYNGAARAYNQAHGLRSDSPRAAPPRTYEDLSLAATLLVLSPAVDVSASYYRARFDVPIGLGDGMRTVGLGIYPLGVAFTDERAELTPYVLAGGAVSYVDHGARSGAMFDARLIGGLRLGRRFSVEVGFRPYAAGGAVDRERIEVLMETYDPRGPTPPPAPGEVVRGGTTSSAVELTVGVSL